MGDDLREIHLIPGGRFVLFLQETGLAIWDMSEAPKVDLVFSIPIENILGLVYRNVIRNEIIQVILELSVQSYPTGFPIPCVIFVPMILKCVSKYCQSVTMILPRSPRLNLSSCS